MTGAGGKAVLAPLMRALYVQRAAFAGNRSEGAKALCLTFRIRKRSVSTPSGGSPRLDICPAKSS
jgi:hypothetical protein